MSGWSLALAIVVLFVSLSYMGGATGAVTRFARRRPPDLIGTPPAVTVLKPLCGTDPELYENLLSFCRQDHPCSQVVFGVRDGADPAVAVVRRLQRELPQADLVLVVDPRVHGANFKVSNLVNMLPAARHDLLVIADSDVRVDPSYLRWFLASLADERVGLATGLYKAVPGPGLWSRLHALWINVSFLPAAVLGEALRIGDGCFGATMALRRRTVDEIGGLEAIADRLADDHALGALVRARGYQVVVSNYLVELRVEQPSFAALWAQELRWARTVRAVAPVGHAGSIIMHGLALTLLTAALDGFSRGDLAIIVIVLMVLLARMAMAREVERALELPAVSSPWLLPLRDGLAAVMFVASFAGRTVCWRGRRFALNAEGDLVPVLSASRTGSGREATEGRLPS